jgi:tRNA uridine 5-carboxymethylaminomethyl modification enzyme
MALATDEGGIQFRILNSSKAVRATRAQADRILYKAAIRHAGEPAQPLAVPAGSGRSDGGGRPRGGVTQVGLRFRARTVVLTAGTFLDGKIHVGLNNYWAAVPAIRRPSRCRPA